MQALPASFVLGEDEVEMMECKQTAGAGNWGGLCFLNRAACSQLCWVPHDSEESKSCSARDRF